MSSLLGGIVGREHGSGMALMFLCTGILGCVFTLLMYNSTEIKRLQKKITGHDDK